MNSQSEIQIFDCFRQLVVVKRSIGLRVRIMNIKKTGTSTLVNASFEALIKSVEKIGEKYKREVELQHLLKKLFDQGPDALLVVNEDGKIRMTNDLARELFGYQLGQLVGHSPLLLLPGWSKTCATSEDSIETSAYKGSGKILNMLAIKNLGDNFCAEVSFSDIALGHSTYTVASIREQTSDAHARSDLELVNKELKITNANLVNLSMTDPLTEVLNRRGLETCLQREISKSKRNNSELDAALIDLDDFKSINDKDGYAWGDRVLIEVARTLKQEFRTVDWVGRIGGDEFLILLPSTSLDVAVKAVERVRLAICSKQYYTSDGSNFRLTASLGVARLPLHISSLEEVLELTTATLHASKQNGKNQVSYGKEKSSLSAESE